MRSGWGGGKMKALRQVAGRIRSAIITRTGAGDIGPEEFVRLAYLVVLRRPADATGIDGWRRQIERGNFSTQRVLDSLLGSEEYLANCGADIFRRLHMARQRWIRSVDAFDSILDIGGSSAGRREGALIELGYPHRPSRLDILDLPPERQFWGTPTFDQTEPFDFDWGRVTYFHGSAEGVANVPALQSRRYQCIFMGQAIEHILPEKLPELLAWIRAHLLPGGRFVMDTPNRAITKIHSPDAYINEDHKLEYTPDQLEEVLAVSGFSVTRKTGLVHLPEMARTGVFDARWFTEATLVHDDADASYLFAFEAVPNPQHTDIHQ
ncbi:hypothetical protein FHW12_002737 [Dokdonella fugitiva]|uniref:DUF4214 domain-containing protein n=1 Tax=Dokdonella fugitiva TaxID=328517 RepID=A0A839F8K0_9GAMM|nr:DUF4214 domain-containing protein [Dokdonella fugitiva]MBA8888504.1 hypothetical protein [Dokdonella fugitiva]